MAQPSQLDAAPARDLLRFIEASPSPFHAVAESARRLEAAGFTRLRERDAAWAVAPGGRGLAERSVVAAAAPRRCAPPRLAPPGSR